MKREDAINKIKEAVKQFKYAMPRLGKETEEALTFIVPELAESEDERVRKHLIEIVETYWGKTNEPGKAADLAWLEKQKESDGAWTEEDDAKVKAMCEEGELKPSEREWLKKLKNRIVKKEQKSKLYWHKIKAYEKLPCKAYIYRQAFEQENNFFGKATIPGFMAPNIPCRIGCDTWYLPVDDIKNLPKEGEDEQKPAEEHDCLKDNPLQEQLNADARKAEDQLIGFIHELISKLSWRKDWTISKEECLRRLNDYCPQPKHEWSEEDEKKITFLERLIRYNVPEGQYGWADGHRGGFITKLEAIAMLKSLRPSWKPSEEQMKALLNAEGYLREGDQFDSAKSIAQLYEQLKKL